MIFCYLVILFDAKLSKIGHNFTKSISLKMICIENVIDKSCSPNLIFRQENKFQEDRIDFWPQKLTLKTEKCPLFCGPQSKDLIRY